MRRKALQAILAGGAMLLLLLVCIAVYMGNQGGADHKDEVEYVIGVSQANMREAWRLDPGN